MNWAILRKVYAIREFTRIDVYHIRTSDDSVSSRIITILYAVAGRGEINAPNRGRRLGFLLILIMLILFLLHCDNVNCKYRA